MLPRQLAGCVMDSDWPSGFLKWLRGVRKIFWLVNETGFGDSPVVVAWVDQTWVVHDDGESTRVRVGSVPVQNV